MPTRKNENGAENGNVDPSRGIVTLSPKYNDEIGEFAKLFDSSEPLREAGRFAFAIGVRTNTRVLRADWSKGERRNIAHLVGGFDGGGTFDFATLLEVLELSDENVRLHEIVSEYVTGGMKWIKENQLKDGINFDKLKETFPDLFPDRAADPDSGGPPSEHGGVET